MKEEKDRDLLRLTYDTVEWHEQITPGIHYRWACKLADIYAELERAKRTSRKIKTAILKRLRNTKDRHGKLLPQYLLKDMLYLDPQYEASEEIVLQLEVRYKKLEAFLEALKMKSSYIVGIQARKRDNRRL